jgi:prepilin-type N-terminal cleavage/methylation domain-containing protein
MKKSGFTLIELMIVVLIIGILAAVGIPRYQNFMMQARQKSCTSQLQAIDQAVSVWETNNIGFKLNDALYSYFDPQDGHIWGKRSYRPGVGYIHGVRGIMPTGRDIVDIVKDGRTFCCPEVARRYGDQKNVPQGNWRVSYIFFKVTPPGEWGGWKSYVPDRIGRACVCQSFGYNYSDGLRVSGRSTPPAGVNGERPNPDYRVSCGGGPDGTRASLHVTWQTTDL